MEERAKKVVHLEHAMEQLKKQLDKHNSGEKVLEDRRLSSVKNRIQSYKGQIYDASRTLSEEVCSVVWLGWLSQSDSIGLGQACNFFLLPRYFFSSSNINIIIMLIFNHKEIEELLGRGGEL